MKFRIELVWEGQDADTSLSIYLTADGRVVLQGKPISAQERSELALPAGAAMIVVDRNMIRAIKDML